MPFAKRAVEPRRLCRSAGPGADLEDLCAVSNAALSRTVRQLSDLARHAGSLFHELERELAATDRRLRDLRERVRRVDRSTEQLDPKLEAVPVSSLDVESKLSEHFQSAWQLHRNVFVPSSRPPCVEELHLHAKQSLSALHRDQQQRQEVSERERRVTILIAPPTPISPSHHTLHTFESVRSSSPTECCHFSRRSRQVDSDPDSVSLGNRSRFPVPNVPSPLDTQTNWSVALPLPTPEDRMKSQSQAVVSCLVPIDVTEDSSIAARPSLASAFLRAGFDRDASVRCSLVYSQSVLQRRRKLRRRKTITGIPRQLQQDFDSDESPAASEQPVLVHSSPEDRQENLTPTRLNTRDSGCQTENFFIAVAAPSRRRIRAQRGQSATFPLSHSTGNIPSLPDSSDTMFTTPISSNLRSHSLPRESARLLKEVQINSDNDDEDLSPFEREQFLSVTGENMLKDEEESTDDQVQSERQLGSFNQHPESPEHVWMQRARSHLPCKSDEISSSSDTFSSPIHSNAGVLASQIDHKDDHQSSSGNWSGSSSTCPSQTSETIPPAASPPLTHCDSELSLNTALNITEDSPEPFSGDRLHSLRGHRTGSSASTATDMLDDGGVSTASEADWSYPQHKHNRCCQKDFSPEGSREGEGSLECPSFVSIATMESLDKPPSDKADTMSHFSVDAEGYYTSMHFDCGLKDSKSFAYNYASVDQQKEGYRGHALNKKHSLSLKKPKVKPLPPERCSSLKKISSHARLTPEMSEPKITPEQNLLMSSKDRNSPLATDDHCDQGADEELVEAWAEQVSNQIPDVALLSSTDKQSLKNKEVVQSDYADLWAVNDLKSNDTCRSLSNSSTATGTTVIERMKSKESSEPKSDSRTASPSLPSVETEFRLPSPEKLVNLASPSSGYSSQSETPTSSSAFFPNPNPLSPVGGKRKPKVPERKSSLTSLQRHTSKEDLELPIIPPTHLDLSALHNGKKPLSHRNHIHILNNTVAMPTTESVDPGSSSPLEITPMMLHSVQLRSVSKLGQETRNLSCTDASTKPKRPTMCQLNESRKPSPYKHLTSESPSEDNCEPMFTPTEELEFGSLPSISFTKNRFDRIAPASLWSTSAFSTMSEEVSRDDMTVDISEQIKGPPEQEELFFPQSSMETKKEQEVVLESTEENPQTESLPDHLITLYTRFEKFDQVPDLILHSSVESSEIDRSSSASNHREETASSGGPTRSASQETIGEVSTPDTEDYFSKESTPSDPQVSPLTDESTTEEDSVFLSPTKSRTTEDLFAMIHRSKRKVLGRKDSKGDVAVRSSPSSTSSPATSPSTPVTPTSSQRASSQIYRSVKKSNTSSEEFKQLLLKRGSRSDSSFRISATEILKSPIASRTLSDSLSEGTKHPEGFPSPFQPQSPEKTAEILHSPYPKTAVEGFSSKVFSSSRQGRSRLPPAANSSRYSTRSRHYTTPMQAISEGETENSDGSPHDDRSS